MWYGYMGAIIWVPYPFCLTIGLHTIPLWYKAIKLKQIVNKLEDVHGHALSPIGNSDIKRMNQCQWILLFQIFTFKELDQLSNVCPSIGVDNHPIITWMVVETWATA
ncbi:hypothetical protein IW261DRAFT_1425160 [Armillaria novae-zelandiae]|uniref:Uncharacterized protein n=1 Tax=Armillaria novae-zelandiae TaxID=153914 RepID=A0AA39NT35_9AGAR|nr:hypothetical protein IW261DRAFT_1425160 [Armillaria novae-zelandiae]